MNDNRGFPKIDHFGSAARIVLEQNKFSKRTTSNRYWMWDPRTLVALLLQSHAFSTMLIPVARKSETLTFIVMLYWFQLNPCKSKSQLMHKQKWSKYPSIKTCHHSSVGKAWDCNIRGTKALGSQVQSLLLKQVWQFMWFKSIPALKYEFPFLAF